MDFDNKHLELYVYDSELNEIFRVEGCGKESLISKVLTLKLSHEDMSHDPDFELAVANQNRFTFFNQDDADSLVKQSLTVRNPVIDNVAFQKKFGFDAQPATKKNLDFRMELLKEEYEETTTAYGNKDAEEVVDGLVDLIVIALGTLHLAGVSVNKAWSEVYRANMSKKRGVKKGREQSGGWDVMKPEGWIAPNHEGNHGTLDELLNS